MTATSLAPKAKTAAADRSALLVPALLVLTTTFTLFYKEAAEFWGAQLLGAEPANPALRLTDPKLRLPWA